MGVLGFYNVIRDKYPGVTEIADKEHIQIWGDVDPEFAYSWFESLANALNKEMTEGVDAEKYKGLLNFISAHFQAEDEEVKNCIDVAFTENLFWQVPAVKAEVYWKILPDNLKELYVNFHRGVPH